MTEQTRKIVVDAATAATLEQLARARGMTLSALLAEMAEAESAARESVEEQIAELRRRTDAIASGAPAVPHDQVVRWLETWGTPDYKPWPGK